MTEISNNNVANVNVSKKQQPKENGFIKIQNDIIQTTNNSLIDSRNEFDEIDLTNDSVSYHVPASSSSLKRLSKTTNENVLKMTTKAENVYTDATTSSISTTTSRSLTLINPNTSIKNECDVASALTDMMLNEIYEKVEPLEANEMAIEEVSFKIEFN